MSLNVCVSLESDVSVGCLAIGPILSVTGQKDFWGQQDFELAGS